MSDPGTVRAAVARVVALGELPDDTVVDDVDVWAAWEKAFDALERPATLAEAVALLDVFPASGSMSFGFCWSLLHFIETAPGWPARGVLDDRSPWVVMLRRRCEAAGLPID